MQVIMSILNQGWVGSILGVLGILSGVYFYLKSNIGAKPVYQVKSIRLIGKDDRVFPERVKIFYDDNEVDRLTKTYLVFWNHGRKTIDGQSIVQSDRLRITVGEDEKILSTTILKRSREVNAVALHETIYNNEVLLSFDFLDPRDGVVLEVFHTSKKDNPEISGTLIGIPKGVVKFGEIIKREKLTKKEKYTNIFWSVGYCGFAFYCFYTNSELKFLLYFTLFFIALGFINFLWEESRRFPKNINANDFIDFE